MSFEKTGIVSTSLLSESESVNMMTDLSAYSYTPNTGNNSCMERYVTGFEIGKQYYVEVLVTWNGIDTSNTSGTFGAWFQGSQYDTTNGWGWHHANPMTDALTKNISLKDLVLTATSGSRIVYGTFTNANCAGYGLGCRLDYSNGTGTIKFSNVKILPIKYYLGSSGSRILQSELITNNFIEY